jgi:D-serine deaminase-like pyridoxal phosphate-dependent protein
MLGGIQAYEGHLVLNPDPSVRDSKTPLANRAGRETKEMIERSGIACPTLSGGGTGTYTFTGSREAGYTELQAGSYVTMDARYSAQMGDTPFGPALSLLSTCIGRPTADRVILDAGQKVVSVEFGPPIVRSHRTMKYLSGVGGDEHGVVMREGEDDVNVGDLVELVPTHGCTAFNLHDWVYGVRNGYVEVIWPVAARGCSW